MSHRHGGDIYRNQVQIDFSVNMNPLGIPDAVRKALYQGVEVVDTYPDMQAEELKRTLAQKLNVKEEWILAGNGASELFMAIVHGIKPQKVVIPIPAFYGYEHAAKAVHAERIYCGQTKDAIRTALTESVELLFLANPNNPTGQIRDLRELQELLEFCKRKGIYVVLDECFIEFSGVQYSMLPLCEAYPNLILVRAFTKIFSIPGVRLGYLICTDSTIRNNIQEQLPEWNLSTFAQKAGIACAKERDFVERTVRYVEKERAYLETGLQMLGLKIFPSKANFIMFYSEKPLYDALLKKGILIRDCGNYEGLSEGYYRIAVKKRKENETLLQAIGESI